MNRYPHIRTYRLAQLVRTTARDLLKEIDRIGLSGAAVGERNALHGALGMLERAKAAISLADTAPGQIDLLREIQWSASVDKETGGYEPGCPICGASKDIDPDTGRPYSNYSSPSLDTSFHDGEMDEGRCEYCDRLDSECGARPCVNAMVDEEEDEAGEYDEERCSNPRGHSWVVRDDNEEISYCEWCGADGNA